MPNSNVFVARLLSKWTRVVTRAHFDNTPRLSGYRREVWQIAIVIEAKMKLESAFGLRVSCPWKDIKAQLNGCRIHQNQAVNPGQFEL